MSNNFERFNKATVNNSITTDLANAQNSSVSDVDAPYGLIEWLVATGETFGTPDDYIGNHMLYIKSWYKANGSSQAVANTKVVNNYAKFLKEVLIVYSNQEEARYLKNLDWSSPYDLDIAVPFFATRLREVILYAVEQRDKIRFQKPRYSYRGSVTGIKKYIYDQIIELLQTERYYLLYGNKLPDIQELAKDLTVTLEEKYDTSDSYTNNPGSDSSLSERTIKSPTDLTVFPDFTQAVSNLLSAFPTTISVGDDTLQTDSVTLIPSLDLSTDSISALSPDYFTTYNNDIDDLNLHLHKKWYEKYIGSTMYYLSGSSTGSYVVDKLFTPQSPVKNHLNIIYPSVASVPVTGSIISARQLGGFFRNTGITHAYSLDHTYTVNAAEITPDTLYTFPDPTVYGSLLPQLTHTEDVRWQKADKANDDLHGDIVDANASQKFYPYQSGDETNVFPKFGVSKVTDNFDFWTGDFKDIWANEDVYSLENFHSYRVPTQTRTDDLLLGDRRVVRWRTDIYGNDYALLKPGSPRIHTETPPEPLPYCRVLDGQHFWDEITYKRPEFGSEVDGSPAFMCYDLEDFVDYAYGGYFSPYECDRYICYEPLTAAPCITTDSITITGHHATSDIDTLRRLLAYKSALGTKVGVSLSAVFNQWDRWIADPSPRISAGALRAGHYPATTAWDVWLHKEAESWYYDPALAAPVQPKNSNFYNGFVIPAIEYSTKYKNAAVVQSFSSDDDGVGLIGAYYYNAVTDEHTVLTFFRCGGHIPYGKEWMAILHHREPGTSTWRHHKLESKPVTNTATFGGVGGWFDRTSAIYIERDGNIITGVTTPFGSPTSQKRSQHTYQPSTLITIDLANPPVIPSKPWIAVGMANLQRPTGYGFATISQAGSYFNDPLYAETPPDPPDDKYIYDFTGCKPKIWEQTPDGQAWTIVTEDLWSYLNETDATIIDIEGCGVFGFYCNGKCFKQPETCPPEPEPTPTPTPTPTTP